MKIDKRLNLVVPVETESGTIYVHSTPISRAIFERYIFIISKTLSVLYEEGLTVFAGPRVAATIMKNIATERGIWEGQDGVQNGLMNEIRRLTNVVSLGDQGWKTSMFYDAAKSEILDEDAISEIEGHLVFFTCVSHMHKKTEVPALLGGMGEVWGTQTSSLNCMEWANSLPISTPAVSSGETETLSSIPS